MLLRNSNCHTLKLCFVFQNYYYYSNIILISKPANSQAEYIIFPCTSASALFFNNIICFKAVLNFGFVKLEKRVGFSFFRIMNLCSVNPFFTYRSVEYIYISLGADVMLSLSGLCRLDLFFLDLAADSAALPTVLTTPTLFRPQSHPAQSNQY